MQIWLNDTPIDTPDYLPLEDALKNWSYEGTTFAVAINQVFVPKFLHAQIYIQPGDRIDIVSPMQGG